MIICLIRNTYFSCSVLVLINHSLKGFSLFEHFPANRWEAINNIVLTAVLQHHSPGLDLHVECFLQQRFGHIASQGCWHLGVAGRVLHHVSHPLLPGDGDGVDHGGTAALHLVGQLPERLHEVSHLCGVLLVQLGQLVVKVTDWNGQ